MDEIVPLLEKRYTNQLNRVKQYNSQDVFQIYANSLAELYDPHTNYLSPRRSENFNINMSLSLEGIGAVLQMEDEYTKVARLVPAGPADKQGDRITSYNVCYTKLLRNRPWRGCSTAMSTRPSW